MQKKTKHLKKARRKKTKKQVCAVAIETRRASSRLERHVIATKACK
jgi:hypothetical protein